MLSRTQGARPKRAPVRRTYVIDHYRSGLDRDELRHLAERVRDAATVLAREGMAIRWMSSTVVPDDEYFQSVIQAASKRLVREAHVRAGVSFERISVAIPIDDSDEA